MHRYTPK